MDEVLMVERTPLQQARHDLAAMSPRAAGTLELYQLAISNNLDKLQKQFSLLQVVYDHRQKLLHEWDELGPSVRDLREWTGAKLT